MTGDVEMQGRQEKLVNVQKHVNWIISRREASIAIFSFAALAMLVSWAMGRDLNWDYFNYHGYAASAPLGERVGQDFFAAGYQGYLNPIVFAPLGWMQDAGWHSLAIGSVLALLHSFNLAFLYFTARHFCNEFKYPKIIATFVAILGFSTSAFWAQVGSTFVDPITTAPIMAAVWMLSSQHSKNPIKVALITGILAGIAVGLKLTNAPYALGMIFAAGFLSVDSSTSMSVDLNRRFAFVALSVAGVLFGFLIADGWWAWRLLDLHGSPIFPLFNSVLKSPDFPAQSVALHRFVPQSISAALWLPLAVLSHEAWIISEIPVPDVRPALLVLLVAGIALRSIGYITIKGKIFASISSVSPVTVFFIVSLIGWMLTSGNARYAIPLMLLMGPLIWRSSQIMLGKRAGNALTILAMVLQLLQFCSWGNPRFTPMDWSGEFAPVQLSSDFGKEPELIVSVSRSSESYLVRYLHKDSVFTNPIGSFPLSEGQPGWSKFAALLNRFEGKTSVLFHLELGKESMWPTVSSKNDMIDRLGLEMDKSSCRIETINVRDPHAIPFIWDRVEANQMKNMRWVVLCKAAKKKKHDPELADKRAKASEILDSFERLCPSIFAPNGVPVEGSGNIWSRTYSKHDLTATVNFYAGSVEYTMERQMTSSLLARLPNWKSDLMKMKCRLPYDGRRDLSTLKADQ